MSRSSDVKQLARSICFALAGSGTVALRGVGAGTVNQMVKACAIARGYLAIQGGDLTVRPGFTIVAMPSHSDLASLVEQTAVILKVHLD